jgi:hypothetical protein
MNNNTIYILIVVGAIILFLIMNNKKETFTNDKVDIENIQIDPECATMTPKQLLSLFNNDINYLSQVIVDNNIDYEHITNPTMYPKIATILKQKKLMKC